MSRDDIVVNSKIYDDENNPISMFKMLEFLHKTEWSQFDHFEINWDQRIFRHRASQCILDVSGVFSMFVLYVIVYSNSF